MITATEITQMGYFYKKTFRLIDLYWSLHPVGRMSWIILHLWHGDFYAFWLLKEGIHQLSQGFLVSIVDHGLIFVLFCHRWLLRCLSSLPLLKQKMDFFLIWALCCSNCVSHLWILFRPSCWRSTPSTALCLWAVTPLDRNPLVYMLLAWTVKQGWLHHLMKNKSH